MEPMTEHKDGTDDDPAPIWDELRLVAVDLEGTGAQDRDNEAILEIAVVPITAGAPDIQGGFTSTINPGRRIPRRPWISAGLTNETLAGSPTLDTVEPELRARLHGTYWIGHNVGVDQRLLNRRCPTIVPAGTIDTLAMLRRLEPGKKERRGLSTVIEQRGLLHAVEGLAGGSGPHRALWDTLAAAALFLDLMQQLANPSWKALCEVLRGSPAEPDDGQLSLM